MQVPKKKNSTETAKFSETYVSNFIKILGKVYPSYYMHSNVSINDTIM